MGSAALKNDKEKNTKSVEGKETSTALWKN